jgi:hypothetical protein
MKRMPDGRFVEIPLEQALDEIADKLPGRSSPKTGPRP